MFAVQSCRQLARKADVMLSKQIPFVLVLVLIPSIQGATVSIDASCFQDKAGSGTITTTFQTVRNIPTSGGCTIGTPPDYGSDYAFVTDFAGGEGGVDYGVTSGGFHLEGFAWARAYNPVPDRDAEPFQSSVSSIFISADLIALSSGPTRPGLIELMSFASVTPDPGGSSGILGGMLAAWVMSHRKLASFSWNLPVLAWFAVPYSF